MSDAPKGWRRRPDGILESNSDFCHRNDPGEAVMTRSAGERKLGCTEFVSGGGGFFNYHMCGKTPKHDLDHNGNPTKCGIHSKEAKEKRKAKSDAKYQAWTKEQQRKNEVRELELQALGLIRKIADGHDNPRWACMQWREKYTKAIGGKK